jgi:hypothetical protein
MSIKPGNKRVSLDVPEKLYALYCKLCLDLGITRTEGLIRYFKYLSTYHHKQRKALDEKSNTNFRLDEGEFK